MSKELLENHRKFLDSYQGILNNLKLLNTDHKTLDINIKLLELFIFSIKTNNLQSFLDLEPLIHSFSIKSIKDFH